jgi:hypothetical protein
VLGEVGVDSYFDEAHFSAKIAHCFRDLGRAEETEKYALRSLDIDQTSRRGMTFNISVLAAALAGQGRVDEACDQGRTAVDMAAGLSSSRVYRYVEDIRRALAPYTAEPRVTELMANSEERLPALRARAEHP